MIPDQVTENASSYGSCENFEINEEANEMNSQFRSQRRSVNRSGEMKLANPIE